MPHVESGRIPQTYLSFMLAYCSGRQFVITGSPLFYIAQFTTPRTIRQSTRTGACSCLSLHWLHPHHRRWPLRYGKTMKSDTRKCRLEMKVGLPAPSERRKACGCKAAIRTCPRRLALGNGTPRPVEQIQRRAAQESCSFHEAPPNPLEVVAWSLVLG